MICSTCLDKLSIAVQLRDNVRESDKYFKQNENNRKFWKKLLEKGDANIEVKTEDINIKTEQVLPDLQGMLDFYTNDYNSIIHQENSEEIEENNFFFRSSVQV